MDPKEAAARAALRYVEEGMVVGLGTGSTVAHAIRALGEEVRGGLRIAGVPTSRATEVLAREVGIPLVSLEYHPDVDVAIDGADEVSPRLHLIKGMGGALVRERIVASAAKAFVVVVDEGKMVEVLGTRSPLPVEVVPFGWSLAARRLEALGSKVEMKREGRKPFESDNGNYNLLCRFPSIPEPSDLAACIAGIPGVVDHGLFLGLATRILVGSQRGVREITRGTP